GSIARYEIDIYAQREHSMYSGIELRNNASASPAYFVFLPLQPGDESKEKALLAFDQILRIDPACAEARQTREAIAKSLVDTSHARGKALLKRHCYAEALSAFRRALEINPAFARSYNGIGNVFKLQGKDAEAIAAYREAISLDANYMWPWHSMGNVLDGLGRLNEALEAYTRTTEINPRYEWGWCNRSEVLRRLGRYHESLAMCEQAEQQGYRFARLYARKGRTLLCLQRHAEAFAAYAQALSLGYQPELWGPIGEQWAAMGDQQKLLGAAVSDVVQVPDTGGEQCYFEQGLMYRHPEREAFVLYGQIYQKWVALGRENSLLGYPVTDTEELPDEIGQHCHFEKEEGCIYWHPDTG